MEQSREYAGSCHCGAVKFTLRSSEIDRGLRCTCSICRRKGALMSAKIYSASELQITSAPDSLSTYTFGSGKAKHHFCKHCGIYTFHETFRFPGHYRVNLGCIDEIDTLNLEFELFDGQSLL